MRLPTMPKRQSQSLAVPDLAGGMNLRDGMSEILDNQLTDVKNMWFSDGVLKTRPGLSHTASVDGKHYCFDWNDVSQDFKKHDVFKTVSGTQYILCSSKARYVRPSAESDCNIETVISFWWANGSLAEYDSQLVIYGELDGYFTVQKGKDIYLFASNRTIYRRGNIEVVYGAEEATSTETVMGWSAVSAEEMYVPLVAAHCQTSGYNLKNTDSTNGVMIEGFNLLNEYYKMTYSSYNENVATGLEDDGITVKQHPMIYHLLHGVADEKYIGKKIRVNYTLLGVTYKHEVTIDKTDGGCYEEKSPGDSLIIAIHDDILTFYKEGSISNTVYALETEYAEDNLEIIAPYIPDGFEEAKDKIFKMTQSCWFGGAASGLAGGTRLFLCGNIAEGEESLVCWSGLDDPLYFPENSYFYVGNSASAATGFGKQSDKLIIFKENETWYTQYYQNTDITAENLIDQTVIDYASSSVFFPLVQINPNIGCPYPNTVQLCRNRLVWLGSGGNVYTLVTENQYNERSIYSVSEMIHSRLAGEITSEAYACDWNGYYCLFLGQNIYLMDYNCYGYTHIASYSKTEDANLRIPWYYWETQIGIDPKVFSVISGELAVVSYLWGGRTEADGIEVRKFDENSNEEIESSLTTKLFAFSAPHYRKNIDRIDLQLGNNGGEPITVEIITEAGSEEHVIYMHSPQTEKGMAGYIENRAVYPTMRHISRLAVKIGCKERLIVDGMIFKFRITGGVR